MKLLVVGGSGFLGRNVLEAARSSWELAGTYLRSATFPAFAAKLGCEPIHADLLGPVSEWDADVCIYVAGSSDHRASLASPGDDLRLNAEALNRFLEGFKGGLVLMSSAAVYDGFSGSVSPLTKPDPCWPYAISKLASERYVEWYVSAGRLSWATILRLYYAYGPCDRATRLIPRILQTVNAKAREFVVTAPKASLLDPLYVGDVAEAALAAASGRAKGKTFDLCGGRARTVSDLVREALRVLGVETAVREKPRSDEKPVRFHSNPGPCRERLGLGRFTTFREGLRRTADWTGV